MNHTFVCNNRTRRQHARLFMEHEWSMFSRRIIHPAEDVRSVRVAALDQVLLPHRDRSTVFGQCRLLKPWGHTLRSKSSLATTLGHLPWAHKQATTEEQFNMVRMKAYSTSCVTGRHERSYMGPDASKREKSSQQSSEEGSDGQSQRPPNLDLTKHCFVCCT